MVKIGNDKFSQNVIVRPGMAVPVYRNRAQPTEPDISSSMSFLISREY